MIVGRDLRGGIEVFYDGGCRLCVASRRWVEARDRAHCLQFHDLDAPATQAVLPGGGEQTFLEMMARTSDGRLVTGFDAWLAVLSVLPRWRWLARALAAPPLRWVGPPVYRVVARHRRRLLGNVTDRCAAPDSIDPRAGPHQRG